MRMPSQPAAIIRGVNQHHNSQLSSGVTPAFWGSVARFLGPRLLRAGKAFIG